MVVAKMLFSRARFTQAATVAALVAAFAFLYRDVIYWLIDDWDFGGHYSHGYLIVPLALYMAWESRDRLRAAPLRPSRLGLLLVLGSLGFLLAGTLGAETFVARVSIIGTVAGTIVYVLGWQHLRILRFPIAFLVFMIPIPAIIFNRIAFPLQLLASSLGQTTIETMGVPVFREGNVLFLANMNLEIVEACSGIRSLVSLTTLAVVYGYFTDPRPPARLALVALTVPIAVAANALRIAGTGVGGHYLGPETAEGFFHSFSGWLMFAFALLLLLVAHRLLTFFLPIGPATRTETALTPAGNEGVYAP